MAEPPVSRKPLPVASTSKPLPSLHWVGPALAGGVALVLLLLAAGLQIPVARSLGEASLVMAASMLTPIQPLDGAAVARGSAGLAASTALLGVGVLSLVGLG